MAELALQQHAAGVPDGLRFAFATTPGAVRTVVPADHGQQLLDSTAGNASSNFPIAQAPSRRPVDWVGRLIQLTLGLIVGSYVAGVGALSVYAFTWLVRRLIA